jgi:hypothetical protein
MTLKGAYEESKALLSNLGKAAMAAQYPDEYEYYSITLELVDSKGDTQAMFTFPVMPNSMQYPRTFLNTVGVTANGIHSVSRLGFNPFDITFSGDFGRSFKLVLQGHEFHAKAFYYDVKTFATNGKTTAEIKKNIFDPAIKTGYGCVKLLQRMVEKAQEFDAHGGLHSLYLYNPSIGENHLVKVQSFNLTQAVDRNMIWQYSLTLKAMIPLENITVNPDKTSNVTERMAASQIQNRVNRSLAKILDKSPIPLV